MRNFRPTATAALLLGMVCGWFPAGAAGNLDKDENKMMVEDVLTWTRYVGRWTYSYWADFNGCNLIHEVVYPFVQDVYHIPFDKLQPGHLSVKELGKGQEGLVVDFGQPQITRYYNSVKYSASSVTLWIENKEKAAKIKGRMEKVLQQCRAEP